jgi:hypothetical protein
MKVGIDFGHTIVNDTGDQDKKRLGILTLVPGAKEALQTMRDRGHIMLLYSHRANRARRIDKYLDPLVRAGLDEGDDDHRFHQARYQQMVKFVRERLPGIFHAIDDGQQGKANVDWTIDNKTIRYRNWKQTMADFYKEEEF